MGNGMRGGISFCITSKPGAGRGESCWDSDPASWLLRESRSNLDRLTESLIACLCGNVLVTATGKNKAIARVFKFRS